MVQECTVGGRHTQGGTGEKEERLDAERCPDYEKGGETRRREVSREQEEREETRRREVSRACIPCCMYPGSTPCCMPPCTPFVRSPAARLSVTRSMLVTSMHGSCVCFTLLVSLLFPLGFVVPVVVPPP